MALKQKTKNPLGHVRASASRDMVAWVDAAGRPQTESVSEKLSLHEFQLTKPARYAPKFNTATNYHGQYFFAGKVGRLIWHESMLEYSSLMWLDHTEHVTGISAQPMMLFLTGLGGDATHRRHVPDYFARLDDGRQVVIDVYPPSRLELNPELVALLDRTAEVCNDIGWEYRRFEGLPRIVRYNLELIAGYRNLRYAPSAAEKQRILTRLSTASTFRDAAHFIDPEFPPRHIHLLYHLMWTRDVVFDLTAPLTTTTELKTKNNV